MFVFPPCATTFAPLQVAPVDVGLCHRSRGVIEPT